jgi:hypothetical protein
MRAMMAVEEKPNGRGPFSPMGSPGPQYANHPRASPPAKERIVEGVGSDLSPDPSKGTRRPMRPQRSATSGSVAPGLAHVPLTTAELFASHSFRMEEVGPEMLDSTTSIRELTHVQPWSTYYTSSTSAGGTPRPRSPTSPTALSGRSSHPTSPVSPGLVKMFSAKSVINHSTSTTSSVPSATKQRNQASPDTWDPSGGANRGGSGGGVGGRRSPPHTPTVKRPTVSVAVPKSHRRLTGTTIPHTPGDSDLDDQLQFLMTCDDVQETRCVFDSDPSPSTSINSICEALSSPTTNTKAPTGVPEISKPGIAFSHNPISPLSSARERERERERERCDSPNGSEGSTFTLDEEDGSPFFARIKAHPEMLLHGLRPESNPTTATPATHGAGATRRDPHTHSHHTHPHPSQSRRAAAAAGGRNMDRCFLPNDP